MKKVAIYCRVSTTKQEEKNQLIDLRKFCKKEKYQIYGEYTEKISGKEENRFAFNQLFLDAHKRKFDVILFWDLSRFSRSGTLYTLQKLTELKNLGVDWISYTEPYFNSIGAFKEVVISILSTLAKIEREKISERTKAGLRRIKKEGKTLGRPKGKKDKKQRIRRYFKKPNEI